MTLPDTLAALSEAAEPENLRSMAIVLRQSQVTFGDVKQTGLAERAATSLDQLAVATEAYRTGQLVPVPSVERVADVMLEGLATIGFMDPMWAGSRPELMPIATAVIAAMKGEAGNG